MQEHKGGVDPRHQTKKGPQTIGKIKKALDFMRNQNFEVPFLAYYRKEYVEPELDISALWKVYHFDAKVSCIILDSVLKLKQNNNNIL